ATPAKNGIFSGNGACKNLTLKNILILKSNSALLAAVAPTASNYEKVVTVDGVSITGATATNGQNTVSYLSDTLGYDFTNVWMAEGDGYRLVAASTNIKSEDATITQIKINTANATTRFKVDEDFTADGLSVMGTYSDGVQLVLNLNSGYEVDSSAVKNEAGTYTVTVTSKEDPTIKETYNVTVAAETGFKVYDEFMPHTYLQGQELDVSSLVVNSTWTDGLEEKIDAKSYVVTGYDKDVAGKQSVTITYGSYAGKSINVSVSASKPVPVDGKIYINVDTDYAGANGAQVKGVETFSTLADAIDYLEACDIDKSVQKVIYIGAGIYEAKITTNLNNLVLIGTGANIDDVVLTYSAVESTVNIVSGGQYGLDCATLQVNGEGFKAYNLAIRNDFNYIRDAAKESSPQGLALTIAGDKAIVENCHLYGNQDTLYLKSGRAYFKNTLIEGNVDFIFGNNNGLAFFDECEIRAISRFAESVSNKSNNGYVTAMKGETANKPDYGYIFSNCEFTHGEGVIANSMSLGRPWGPAATVAMINCSFSEAYSQAGYDGSTKSRWFDMSGNKPQDADFCEFGSKDASGNAIMQEAVAGGSVLNAQQAENYTAAKLFAGTNGKLTWASGDWTYANDVALLSTLYAEKVTTVGTLYVSTENIIVAEEGTAELLATLTPWNLDDKSGLTIMVADENIATYSMGLVRGISAGTTTITVSCGSETKTVSVTVTPQDLTITDPVEYVFGGSNYEELTEANTIKYIGKMSINTGENGSFIAHSGGSKYFKLTGDASIEFTVKAGTLLKFTTYGNELLLKLNGEDVTGNGEFSGAGDCIFTYSVVEDGVLSMSVANGKNQLYLTSIVVMPPVVGAVSVGGEAEAITIQNGSGLYKGMFVDATANGSKFYARTSNDVQVAAGTVLYVPIEAGSTVAITWYNASQPQYGAANNAVITYNADKTLAIITFCADTITEDADAVHGKSGIYFTAITVVSSKTTYEYISTGENAEAWVLTKTGTATSQDSPALVTDSFSSAGSLALNATGTKATLSINGYTAGSGNANAWMKIEFLDASGAVLETVTGTTTAGKLNGAYTLSKSEVETAEEFVSIKITCTESNKTIAITTATI
ncbi:MAG: bacterial Ig-like domain-containing protein, partial [Lactobacillus sp.]|nr:bacterial Ig-like domain-containing protein [Lactobacillus sp.]